MGQLVLAAKVTHVPSLMLSEQPGSSLRAAREPAVSSLRELGRRARERGVTSFVVFDTHWLSNFGYHVNANARHRGSFTSHEAPQMIQDLRYDLPGDTRLASGCVLPQPKDLAVPSPHTPREHAPTGQADINKIPSLQLGDLDPLRAISRLDGA